MIEVHSLTKCYGRRRAVDDLSFVVRPGRVTGFLGPNGAGKSTTMRVVLGLDAPTSGHTLVCGRPYRELERPLRTVGALLDARAVPGGRRADLHLRSVAVTNGIGRRRVDEVIELVGLAPVARRRVQAYSLGMAQRLGLAVALLGDPAVLVLDEPVNGLDTDGIRWIRDLLRRLAADGRTVFVSSHLMSEMELTADHLVIVGRGRLLADAPMRDVIERFSRPMTRVRTPAPADLRRVLEASGAVVGLAADGAWEVLGADAATIGDLARDHGIGLHELSPLRSTLEEAYTAMTDDLVDHRAPAKVAR